MITEAETTEYLDEIRRQVCSRCVERPPGGPPCEPLGKACGVEMHLPELIDSIHEIRSSRIAPYLDHNRSEICSHCTFLHSSICPCPMDYLAVLVVEAVDTVDKRHAKSAERRAGRTSLNVTGDPTAEGVFTAFEKATGTWTGCDWPTHFAKSGLNLNGMTAADAERMAVAETSLAEDWRAAARWLTEVERRAREAEEKAAAAVKAAVTGRWEEALVNADRAWALEFSTGRPLRREFPLAWQDLRDEVEAAMGETA